MRIEPYDRQRFQALVDTRSDSECHEWKGGTNKKGYGQFRVNGRTHISSRIAYIIYFGDIPDGLFVLHKCDNPPCCNPDHLFLGTQVDNMADMIQRGRQFHTSGPRTWIYGKPENVARGERHGRAMLREDEVREIRALREKGWYYVDLAERFNVSVTATRKIVHKETWTHI
jgi:hypothetical protein